MMPENDDFKDDELITVKMPRGKYKTMMQMIEREETYSNIGNMLKSSWIWVVGGGILTLILLWDRIHLGVK